MAYEDPAFLDPPYQVFYPPQDSHQWDGLRERGYWGRNHAEALIARQTPVRAQGKRGTCSIFSATAILEFHLVNRFGMSPLLDLSEEWLEYLATRNKTTDGSSSWRNFDLMAYYGMLEEELFPYIGETWESLYSSPLAKARCGHLNGRPLQSCLLGHRDGRLLSATDEQLQDPQSGLYDLEFLAARQRAFAFRDHYIRYSSRSYVVGSVSSIRSLLDQGVPLTMGISFYYGAWNHRKAPELGMKRDLAMWYRGIVGYPEPGSVDAAVSPTKAAGHSIVIVGYDDSQEVKTTVQMADGSTKAFTYKGVYYFKNSWGVNGFGKTFHLGGRSYPGYGMITQKYAHKYGTFFQLPIVGQQ